MATASLSLFITHLGLLSLTSRAVWINLACSGAALTITYDSTAMQCPPTPGPGCRMFTRGAVLPV